MAIRQRNLKREVETALEGRWTQAFQPYLRAPVKPSGGGYVLTKCPFHHPDNNPSFQFNPENGSWNCFAGCGEGDGFKFIEKVKGVDFNTALHELAGIAGISVNKPAKRTANKQRLRLTLAEYAKAKQLPKEFLESLGLTDGIYYRTPVVKIPYLMPNGELLGTRLRRCMPKAKQGKDQRFVWDTDFKELSLYGLWRDMPGDWAMLVEGESDCHTLWYYGIPAYGVPGAGNYKAEWTTYLTNRQTLYLWQEHDKPAEQFIAKTTVGLHEGGFTGKILIASMAEFDDVSDLHQTDPKNFKARLEAALKEAREPDPAEIKAAQKRVSRPKYNLTELGNAKRLVYYHGKNIRYVHPWGKWIVWNGKQWAVDNTAAIQRMAKDTVAKIYEEARDTWDEEEREAIEKHARSSESERKLHAMINLASSEEGIPALPEELDNGAYLLNVGNGTLDLTTGALLTHKRKDLLTKLTPIEYDPDAKAPRWEAFVAWAMDNNQNLISFLQRAIGYSLTADVSEQVLFFCHGTGDNGKSVFLETILAMLGPYGKTTAQNLLMASRFDDHPTGVADLMGTRMAVSIETGESRRLDETLVKSLTGGDRIKARFMRQDFFEFEPTHKIWLATNHKPIIRGTDHAIWRRIRLIPFSMKIAEEKKDPQLVDKLKKELPGILAWAVEGCLQWQEHGLGLPEEVKAATDKYRQEMDVLGDFIDECCYVDVSAIASAQDLYDEYREWCETTGERAQTRTWFGRRLGDRGFEREKRSGKIWWLGIGLNSDRITPGEGRFEAAMTLEDDDEDDYSPF
ncbi:MAG: phage/plasmid primase, P4 family [Bacillota bacterium]|jgi:putative DNA primase/helicase